MGKKASLKSKADTGADVASDAALSDASQSTAISSSTSTTAEADTTASSACPCGKCLAVAPVHPVARFVAGLLSTMSVRDQYSGGTFINNAFYIVTPLSFLISMYVGKFWICVYSIIGLGSLSLLLFLFNLTQRPNPDKDPKSGILLNDFVPIETNERYYQALNNVGGFLGDFSEDGLAAKSERGKAALARRAAKAEAKERAV